jgi:DNA helicase-2/ATP-dependent DNA helicase PcrA
LYWSTIVESVKLLPKDKSIMFLAFNKHIQEELKTKLPEYVRCYTTYGLGTSAIKRKYGDSIQFDEFKLDKIIQKKSKSWDLNDEFDDEEEISFYLNSIKKLVNLSRLTLTLKPEYIPYIADRYEVNNLTKPNDIKRVLKVLDESTTDRKTFDYTDMIYLPAIDNSIWMFPQDYVFLDEVQDLNKCQIRIIEKILKKDKVSGKYTGRLISVGDFFQGVYGFNAADDKSFEWFEKFQNTKVLPLSVSFRCAKNIIIKAQEIVPDIKALEDAPDGIVRDGDVFEAQSGDFILCRTTMPLVKLFFEFLVRQKKAIIKGRDIGLQLIDLIGKINTIEKLKSFWNNELSKFRKDLKAEGVLNPNEHSGYSTLEDKVMTLLFLAKLADNIPDLKLKISTIFTDDIQGICLSTVHKIKGLEANRVFIIRPDLLPMKNVKSWQYIQEKNLEYVAITRAKLELIYDKTWTDES